MTEGQISEFLRLVGTQACGDRWHEASQTTWIQASCPLAPVRHQSGQDANPSFAVAVTSGESYAHCFSCGFRGRCSHLVRELANEGLIVPVTVLAFLEKALEGVGLELAEGDYEEVFTSATGGHEYPFDELMLYGTAPAYDLERRKIHRYLKKRRTPLEVAAALDIRWNPHDRRIVFPIRDWSGRLMGLRARATDPNDRLRYMVYKYNGKTNPHVWYGEHLVQDEDVVVMVESVFDLARVFEVHRNVLAPLSASISWPQLSRVRHLRSVVTFFDGDQAGNQARRLIEKHLPRVQHVLPDDNTDPSDMSVEEVQDRLSPFLDPLQ